MSNIADSEVFGRVRWAFEKDARLPSSSLIHLSVEDGVVQLWGEVGSGAEKAEAEAIARVQRGVKDVVNGLTVVIATPRLDERKELLGAVQRALEQARGVPAKAVGVRAIDRGTVRLAGRVSSLAEEQAAIAAVAAVPGVRDVASEVQIGEVAPGDAIAIVDDPTLRSMVNSAIAKRGVAIYSEDTLVDRGIVRLRGRVIDEREVKLAEQAAAAVAGVQDVVNELVLDHALTSTNPDEALAARVTQALERDGRVSPAEVHAECIGGDCRLFGYVDSIDDQNDAVAVARNVIGVRRVLNDIVIRDRTSLGSAHPTQAEEREQGA